MMISLFQMATKEDIGVVYLRLTTTAVFSFSGIPVRTK